MSGGKGKVAEMAKHLVVKLVRGTAGKKKIQLATLKTLNLTKSGRQVVVPNTPGVRGKLEQVSHLISIKTLEAYNQEVAEQREKLKTREPLVVKHNT